MYAIATRCIGIGVGVCARCVVGNAIPSIRITSGNCRVSGVGIVNRSDQCMHAIATRCIGKGLVVGSRSADDLSVPIVAIASSYCTCSSVGVVNR